MSDRYLQLGECSTVAGVSKSTLRRAIYAGELPATKTGTGTPRYRRLHVRHADLLRWIESGRVEPPVRAMVDEIVGRVLGGGERGGQSAA